MTRFISAVVMPLTLGALLTAAVPQGKGQGGERKAEKSQKRGAEKSAKSQVRAADKNDKSDKSQVRRERVSFRTFAVSDKRGRKLAGRAVERATKHGVSEDDFIITPVGTRVHVLNRSGVLLLDLDDDREVGRWKVVTENDRNNKGSPSFCRSGAGHPVWGRQWCIDKGFGLGRDGDLRWARVIELDDNVVFRTRPDGVIARDVLVDVLGNVVFDRLATHAISLGLVEPLAGRWLGEPNGGRVLLLSSGDRPIAELVDLNRDDRAEMLVVAVRPK